MRLYGVSNKFSEISDADIDRLIRHYHERSPESGLRYIMGFFRTLSLRVQRQRVIDGMRRTDGVGVVLRAQIAVKRRTYRNRRPNALWHLDGHHKLIKWGIVIHGIIDGFCRTVRSV